jgi:hypothetical protein
MTQRARYFLSVPLYYAGEVAAFAVGSVAIVALAGAAALLAAVAVASFTGRVLREEVGSLCARLREPRT